MLTTALLVLLSAPAEALSPPVPDAVGQVERTDEGITVTGSVSAPPGADHQVAAAGQAWHGVASQLLAQGNAEAAYAAATSGVEELGSAYKSGPVRDDTGMKLAAAKAQLAAGEVEAAAEVAIEQLGARLALYEKTHGVSFVQG